MMRLWEVKKEVEKRDLKSLIIITSPTHSKRSWLAYKKVFDDMDVRIISLPTRYSQFKTNDWWKKTRYLKDVLLEYEKLVYYKLKYGI